MHRAISEIDAERAAVSARLNELQIERDAARQAEIDGICRLFDAGLSIREIARDVRQSPAAVQGVVNRSGRTEAGRIAIRHQIAGISGAPSSQTHAPHVGGGYVAPQPEPAATFPGAT